MTKCLLASLTPCIDLINRLKESMSIKRFSHRENDINKNIDEDKDDEDKDKDDENEDEKLSRDLGSLSLARNTRSVAKSVSQSTGKDNVGRKVLGEWSNRLCEENLFIHNNPEYSYLIT